jgi:hypothetical protein
VASWDELTAAAPRIAAAFRRRHEATGHLCLLGTLRRDGFPRISPMEPHMFEGQLWLHGMPGTAKWRDLVRDPRFTLHTATADPQVTEGDAKLWGTVQHVPDPALHDRYAAWLLERTGFDLRGATPFEHFFRADILGASALAVGDDHLDITVWRQGGEERVIRKD